MILRDYQARDVPRIHDALVRSRRATYVLPTGGGKTVVFAEISRLCNEAGSEVDIVVHRDTLLLQASAKLTAFGVQHTVIAPGRTDFGDAICVASVQTLVRRLGRRRTRLLIVDEGHHGVAGSYRKLIDADPELHVLTVTATPQRMDGRGLAEISNELVLGPNIRELMDAGYLAEAAVYGAEAVAGDDRLRVTGGDYNARDVEELMDRRAVTGDAVAQYRKHCDGAPAIAFCATVKHAEDVAAQFREAGYRFEAIHGKQPASHIRRVLGGLSTSEVQGVCSCELVSEGFDAPDVVAGILLRQTRSLVVHMQQVGRVLRPVFPAGPQPADRAGRLAAIAASRKPCAVILDHAGNSFRHGLPDEVREWSLDAARKRATPSIALKTCPGCFSYSRPWERVCRRCGRAFVVAEREAIPDAVAGDLVRLDPAKMRRLREREEAKAVTYPQLRELGIRRGHAPKWAYNKWLARGGRPEDAR